MTSSFSASTSSVAELRDRLVEMVLADVGDDDVHARALQRLGDAEADALTRRR